MSDKVLHTTQYKLFPSPRNRHAELFVHQVFVPYPYTLIDLASYYLQGRSSLYAACRLSDNKMGQLVSCELEADALKFRAAFVAD